MSQTKKSQVQKSDLNTKLMQLVFAALESRCECEVCIRGKELAHLVKDNFGKTGPRVIKEGSVS